MDGLGIRGTRIYNGTRTGSKSWGGCGTLGCGDGQRVPSSPSSVTAGEGEKGGTGHGMGDV